MKILLAAQKPFAPVATGKINEIIASAGHEMSLLENYSGKEELLNAVADADGLIVRSDIVDKEVFEAANNLKIVVRAGAGYDNIDCQEATERKVVVMNTPGQNSNAVAELAIGLMIYGARNFFSGKMGNELKGRTLGLHGFGHVSANLFRIAKGFEMNTSVFTRHSRQVADSIGLKTSDSLERLYADSDFISLHIPARKENIRMINYELLRHLKLGAVLINTARKEIIDEEGLVAIMEQRKDIKYLSDMIPDSKEIFEKKFTGRYYFTPIKMGAQTNEANINAGIAAAEQTVSFFKTGNETFRVNF
jgi:D-3-phosphoglycerate dehydrogenase / 2-oxoglutarate reductase